MTNPANLNERVTRDLAVLGGKPVVRGGRIPVSLVVDFIAAGDTIDEVLDAYPAWTREDVEAALAPAARARERMSAMLRQSAEGASRDCIRPLLIQRRAGLRCSDEPSSRSFLRTSE
jgi:uncharacterized protein (DUF433 family)